MSDQPPAPTSEPRPFKPALLLGLRSRCPACGEGRLFARFLKPVAACSHCGQRWDGHQADDFPAYIVILLLGHLLVPLMIFVTQLWVAVPILILIGACAGFFVVPMNALLQHRGHMLMGAGHSIAVQNFNENLSILIMTGLYAALLAAGLSVFAVMVMFGLFVAATMFMVGKWHKANQRKRDDVSLLDDGFGH